MAASEAKVLKPRNPNVLSEDDWPTFILHNAEVRDPKTGDLVSLLAANARRPLTLSGRLLTPDAAHLHCLIQPSPKNPYIEVVNVIRYAFGQYEDGVWAAWGLGRSGWFEVYPSKAYKDIHQDIAEAVEINYFLEDYYAWDDQKIGHQAMFHKYAQAHPDKANNAKSAAKLFYKHREFLAQEWQATGTNKSENVRWAETPLYQHFASRFPELFRPANRPTAKTPTVKPASRAGSVRSRGSVRSTNSSVLHPRTTRLRSVDSTSQRGDVPDNVSTTSSRKRDFTPMGPSNEELEAKAKGLWRFVLDTYKKFSTDPDDLNLDVFATELHTWFVFEDLPQASDFLCALGPQLLALMDRSRACKWADTAIYQTLKEVKLPAVSRKRVLSLEVEARSFDDAERIRRLHAGEAFDEIMSLDESSDDEQLRPKSALRPIGSRFADKGAKRRGKHYRQLERGSDEDGDQIMEHANSPTERKAEQPRRPGRPRKRKAEDAGDAEHHVDDDEGEDGTPLQHVELPLRRKPDPQVAASRTNGASHSRREHTWQHNRNTRSNPRPPSPAAIPPIIIEELPSDKPNGPGNTWICDEDGCMHKIYGATKPLGKRLISVHIAEHEEQRKVDKENIPAAPASLPVHEGAMDLIRAEEELCNLPVSNLISRIRDLAASSKGEQPAFPVPVGRRY